MKQVLTTEYVLLFNSVSSKVKMLISVLLLSIISSINAKLALDDTALNRVTRALPPKYLSVEGFKNCLVSYAEDISIHWCFPLKKLPGCPIRVWNELGDAYKPQNERKIVGGHGGLPSTYHQVIFSRVI